MSDTLSIPDLRRALRLLVKLHAMPPGVVARRRQMMAGLCGMGDARACVSGVVSCLPEKGAAAIGPRFWSPIHLGIDGSRRRAMLQDWCARPDPPDPAAASLSRLLRRRWRLTTRSRGQLVRSKTWYASAHVQE